MNQETAVRGPRLNAVIIKGMSLTLKSIVIETLACKHGILNCHKKGEMTHKAALCLMQASCILWYQEYLSYDLVKRHLISCLVIETSTYSCTYCKS